MKFVDYKCLESLLIEGEDLIATEGFIDTIKKKIIDFFKMIGKMITKLISIIKTKFSKGSSKKVSANKEEEIRKAEDRPRPVDISDEDAKKSADSIKQRYENSEQYKKHKEDSEAAKKQMEDARAAKNKALPDHKKKKNCASKLYDMILKINDVSKSMFTLTLDLYKLEMQSTEHDKSPLRNRFDAIEDKINAIEEIYDIINDTDNYYLGIDGYDSKEHIIKELEITKSNIDDYIKTFEKHDKAAKSVYKDNPNSANYNMYTPMIKNCSKLTSLISNIINLVNKMDTKSIWETGLESVNNDIAAEATIDSSLMMDDEIYSKIYYKAKNIVPNKYKIIYVHIMCADDGNKHSYRVNIRAKENANSEFVTLTSLKTIPMSKIIQTYTEISNIINPERAKLNNHNKWESMTIKYENDSFSTNFTYAN